MFGSLNWEVTSRLSYSRNISNARVGFPLNLPSAELTRFTFTQIDSLGGLNSSVDVFLRGVTDLPTKVAQFFFESRLSTPLLGQTCFV